MKPIDYGMGYFKDSKEAGYHNYERTIYPAWADDVDNGLDQGEYFKTQAYKLFLEYDLHGKRVLDLGCAYGFVTRDLNDFGADCIGVDISQFAIDQSDLDYKTYRNDAYEYLKNSDNKEYDLIIGLRFLPCLNDLELAAIVPEINRVGRRAYFTIDDTSGAPEHYNMKSVKEWSQLGWDIPTRIVAQSKIVNRVGDEWEQ